MRLRHRGGAVGGVALASIDGCILRMDEDIIVARCMHFALCLSWVYTVWTCVRQTSEDTCVDCV